MEKLSKIIELGLKSGLSEVEVFYLKNSGTNILYENDEFQSYSIKESQGAMVKGIINDKAGYAFLENFEEDSINNVIASVKENAEFIDSEDKDLIFEGSKHYEEIKVKENLLKNTTPEEEKEFIEKAIAYGKSLDKRIIKINYAVLEKTSSEKLLINSKGLELKDENYLNYFVIGAIAKENNETTNQYEVIILEDLDFDKYKWKIERCIKKTIGELGSKPIKSSTLKTLLSKETCASLLGYVFRQMNAENVIKKLSMLEDKIGEEIMSPLVTIVDDPFLENGVAKTSFDGEGVATRKKVMVEKGVLKMYFADLKNAGILGCEATGNKIRESYTSPGNISPTNIYMEKGKTSFEDLLKKCKYGIFITEVQGLHAGMTGVNGDFSLPANGFVIEDGKLGRPVNQITIAGNIYEVLKEVEAVGNEIEFFFGNGYIGMPDLLVGNLSISGE